MHHRCVAVIGFKGVGHRRRPLRRKQAAILRDSSGYKNPEIRKLMEEYYQGISNRQRLYCTSVDQAGGQNTVN